VRGNTTDMPSATPLEGAATQEGQLSRCKLDRGKGGIPRQECRRGRPPQRKAGAGRKKIPLTEGGKPGEVFWGEEKDEPEGHCRGKKPKAIIRSKTL